MNREKNSGEQAFPEFLCHKNDCEEKIGIDEAVEEILKMKKVLWLFL